MSDFATNPGTWCGHCQANVHGTHYHCAKCEEISSMMGHLGDCPVPKLGGWAVGDEAVFNHRQDGPTEVTVIAIVRESDAGPHLVVEHAHLDVVTMAEPHELSRPTAPEGDQT